MTLSPKYIRLTSPYVYIPILVIVICSLAVYWFVHNFERKSYKVEQGLSPEAVKNQFLAAENYLQALGIATERRKDSAFFMELPSTNDALFLSYVPASLNQKMRDELYQWIFDGGHLLVSPHPLSRKYPEKKMFLDRFGIRWEPRDSSCGCNKKSSKSSPQKSAANTKQKKKTYHPHNRIADVNIDGKTIQLKILYSPLLEDLYSLADFKINGSYRKVYNDAEGRKEKDHNQFIAREKAWLLQSSIGAGKITVLSDKYIFYNATIDNYDHAYLLYWLLKGENKVWFYQSSDAEPLLNLAWKAMPQFWISSALILLVLLWKMQKRSGSLLALQKSDQHNILMHIEATGNFFWRTKQNKSLLDENRKILLQRWILRRHGNKLEQESQENSIGPIPGLGITEEDLYEAFHKNADKEQDLISISRAMKKIEATLRKGDTGAHNEQ